jgi:hypothetical protein
MVAALVIVLLTGCSEPEARQPAADGPARRQLDSMVARSRLPGAPAVGRALVVLGQTEARAAAHDTIR